MAEQPGPCHAMIKLSVKCKFPGRARAASAVSHATGPMTDIIKRCSVGACTAVTARCRWCACVCDCVRLCTGNPLMSRTPPQEADSPSRSGLPLKKRTPPQEADYPPHEGGVHPPLEASFHFASRLQKKEPKSWQATMMLMKVHVSSLHAPIYRNFYLCVQKNNFFKHFNVERPVKVCVLTGVSHAPPPKLQRELCLQVSFWNQGLFPCNPDHPGHAVYRSSSRRCEVNNS